MTSISIKAKRPSKEKEQDVQIMAKTDNLLIICYLEETGEKLLHRSSLTCMSFYTGQTTQNSPSLYRIARKS